MTEMNFPPGIAYQDGEYLPIREAKISVLDFGFLHSDATYDVVTVWKGCFFRLEDHLDRFFASVAKLHMSLPVDRETLRHILAECTQRACLEDAAYVEMVCTRGISPTFSRDPRDAVNRFIAFAIPFSWILKPEDWEKGLHLAVARDIRRIPANAVDPVIKNYHWLDFVRGQYDAYARGAQNVLLSDGSGHLAEGPGFNVFAASRNAIATPEQGVLEGITRKSVLELAAELGIDAHRRPLSIAETMAAEEVFISSSAGGVMPVTRIDGRIIGDGLPGPLTRALSKLYWAKHSDPKWTTPISEL